MEKDNILQEGLGDWLKFIEYKRKDIGDYINRGFDKVRKKLRSVLQYVELDAEGMEKLAVLEKEMEEAYQKNMRLKVIVRTYNDEVMKPMKEKGLKELQNVYNKTVNQYKEESETLDFNSEGKNKDIINSGGDFSNMKKPPQISNINPQPEQDELNPKGGISELSFSIRLRYKDIDGKEKVSKEIPFSDAHRPKNKDYFIYNFVFDPQKRDFTEEQYNDFIKNNKNEIISWYKPVFIKMGRKEFDKKSNKLIVNVTKELAKVHEKTVSGDESVDESLLKEANIITKDPLFEKKKKELEKIYTDYGKMMVDEYKRSQAVFKGKMDKIYSLFYKENKTIPYYTYDEDGKRIINPMIGNKKLTSKSGIPWKDLDVRKEKMMKKVKDAEKEVETTQGEKNKTAKRNTTKGTETKDTPKQVSKKNTEIQNKPKEDNPKGKETPKPENKNEKFRFLAKPLRGTNTFLSGRDKQSSSTLFVVDLETFEYWIPNNSASVATLKMNSDSLLFDSVISAGKDSMTKFNSKSYNAVQTIKKGKLVPTMIDGTEGWKVKPSETINGEMVDYRVKIKLVNNANESRNITEGLDFPEEHKELCPSVWNNETVKGNVRKVALSYALDMIKELKKEEIGANVIDIWLTGSLAGYRYRKDSDFDLHIILELENPKDEATLLYLKSKGKELNSVADKPFIGEHPIEIYFQPKDEEHFSNGIYSLYKNEWIKKPDRNMEGETKEGEDLANKVIEEIISVLEKYKETGDVEKITVNLNRIMEKFLKMRGTELKRTNSELNKYNIAFKILRKEGYIDRIKSIIRLGKYESYEK